MSVEIRKKAIKYLDLGLNVIPLKKDKTPVGSWKHLQTTLMNRDAIIDGNSIISHTTEALGIICGAISGSLEVIDVDIKHDTTGSLWDELKDLIQDNLPELYTKLVIAQTKSGGYHIYYRCSKIEGNLKLATKENKEVLIETRGEGGYVVAPPSEGYTYIQGEPDNIPTITTEERDYLLSICRTFNEIIEVKPEEIEIEHTKKRENSTGKTSIEDYNDRGSILDLLLSEGWSIVKHTKDRVYVKRPGKTDTKYSGNYYSPKNCLMIFSSSTEFKEKKPYSPAQVYNILKCKGDWKQTAKELGDLDYGDMSYRGGKATNIKTDKIKVVNSVNKVNTIISEPGDTLKVEDIENAKGDLIIIAPDSGATEEVLKAIDLFLLKEKRVYIKQGEIERPEYVYLLDTIYDKYALINEQKGELSLKDIDSLLDEIVSTSVKLTPLDRDIFKRLFLTKPGIDNLGITEESLSITIDRLTSTREKEAQDKELKKLLTEVTQLQEKGDTNKALELLDTKVKEVKLKDKATEFSSLLLPTSEAQVKKAEETKPTDLETGYTISGEDFLLPGGAITVYAGATGHGKTILTINTALNVAKRYPDKKFIFFTYEERDTAILHYFLNTYIDRELNSSTYSKSNRRLIKEYFKTGSTQYIAKENINYFESKKAEFFKEYIETGRILIKYVDYSSQELDLAIRYLHKTEPNIGGVFIDYFQLLNLPGEIKRAERINSRQEELKKICQSLNRVAVDTGLPLILGAQFNRDVTDLTKLHPTKIGEAGDIERIVNTLIGLWDVSKNIVGKDTSKGEESEIKIRTGEATTGMYIELLKSRELQTGIYELLDYNGKTGKIKNRSSYF